MYADKVECLFCSELISYRYLVCPLHLHWYKKFNNQQWFKELVKMRDKYNHRDRVESYQIPASGQLREITPTRYSKSNLDRYTKELIAAEYEYVGKTPKALADKYKIHRNTVYKVLDAYGLETNRAITFQKECTFHRDVLQDYSAGEITCRELADKYQSPLNTIKWILHKNGMRVNDRERIKERGT